MATKLRKFSTNKVTKAVAFILLVGLIVSVITQILIAGYRNYSFGTVFSKKYIYSDKYRSDVITAISSVTNALDINTGANSPKASVNMFKAMEYIDYTIMHNKDYMGDFAAGKAYVDSTMSGETNITELEEYKAHAGDIKKYLDYVADIAEYETDIYEYVLDKSGDDQPDAAQEIYTATRDGLFAYRNYVESIISYKSGMDYAVSDGITTGYGALKFYYYAANGGITLSNTAYTDKSDFERLAGEAYFYENGSWQNSRGMLSGYFNSRDWWYGNDNYTFYLAFTDGSIAEIQSQWDAARNQELVLFASIIGQIICGIIIFLFLAAVTGREPEDRELHSGRLDNIYSDILLAAGFIAFYIPAAISYDIADYRAYRGDSVYISINTQSIFELCAVGVIAAVSASVCICIVLSLIRKIKAGKFFKHSLVFAVLFTVYDFFRSIFDGRKFAGYPLTKSLFYRQVIFLSASAVLAFFVILFSVAESAGLVLPVILELVIVYWYVKGGNKTFEEINRGFNDSLDEQMRAERMKIALVTNVSHDLKTPLTSIISYVDLMSKEVKAQNFTNINDYINILAEKSDRLKHIVSDLFDLAKSTSGNIDMEFERLDMVKLVEQTLADMSDKTEQSRLQLKIKLPGEPVFVMSDGKKLYRVLQNVIDNAIKYSLDGTRVFIELEDTGMKAVITVKNTSAYEMDFSAEEVLGRFIRGDKSRSTEGSGLGLSIAESFTNACGGNFSVHIDGDQFKVLIELQKNR